MKPGETSGPAGQQDLVGSESEFKQAVQERTLQVKRKAEELRLDGLRRIADMKSRTGIHPLDRIPMEMWALILDKLKPEDRANMYQVHDVFRDLLENNLIRDILFPLVIMDYKIPLSRKLETPGSFFGNPTQEALKELLTLRLVSKSLRDAVDRWIENRLSQMIRGKLVDTKKYLNTTDFYLAQDKEVLDGLLLSGPIIGRPKRFFTRSLSVSFSSKMSRTLSDRETTDYFDINRQGPHWFGINLEERKLRIPEHLLILKNNFTEFLKTVGDQILHLHLCFKLDDLAELGVVLSFADVYNMIRDWLMLVPNLKWLVLEMECENRDTTTTTRIMNEPMPSLSELEKFNLLDDDVNPIANAILSANPHIKDHFNRRILQCIEDPSDTEHGLLMANLHLETVFFWVRRSADLELTVLRQITNNNWQLKRMSLCVVPEKDKDNLSSMNHIFGFLQRFQTLEILDLHVRQTKTGEGINYLHLPNLKDLWLELEPPSSTAEVSFGKEAHFLFSLQFLWHCKKLRSLIWQNYADSRLIRKELEQVGPDQGIWIEFMGGTGDLSGSNVWDVFPELRNIKVELDHGFKREKDYNNVIYSDKASRWEYQRRKLTLQDNGSWIPEKFFGRSF